jgi:hypothetical protein
VKQIRPTSYFLAQEQDHYLRNWRMEGSDDGTTWTTIRDHVNDTTLTTSNRWTFFDLKATSFYQRIRLFVYGPSHNGSPNFDITEVEFYGIFATLSQHFTDGSCYVLYVEINRLCYQDLIK